MVLPYFFFEYFLGTFGYFLKFWVNSNYFSNSPCAWIYQQSSRTSERSSPHQSSLSGKCSGSQQKPWKWRIKEPQLKWVFLSVPTLDEKKADLLLTAWGSWLLVWFPTLLTFILTSSFSSFLFLFFYLSFSSFFFLLPFLIYELLLSGVLLLSCLLIYTESNF